MSIVVIDPIAPDPHVLARAAELLRSGYLVAFPTETVYGLGAHALDAAAVRRIYEAKGRPAFNPLIVHVADVDGARAITREWPDRAQRLAEVFWPGPLTLVLPKRERVPAEVSAGLDSVAVRVPAHPVALALLVEARIPVAAPSANRSMGVSPTTAQHVAKGLGDRVDLVLDGGRTEVGIESTVLDLTQAPPVILRPGAITRAQIEQVLGERVRSALALPDDDARARPSPGMMERHYAPNARVMLVDSGDRAGANEAIRAAREGAERVGVIDFGSLASGADEHIVMPRNASGYAQALYAALHTLDDARCHLIIVERVPDDPSWDGVRDRLSRASH
jgi:L-threonylcarbamoyladenylate synthase